MTQYGFYFDATRCTGCKTCEAACRDYHDLPLSYSIRHVYELEGGGWEQDASGAWTTDSYTYYTSFACCHCDNPACTKVCPTGAMHKDDMGLVSVDEKRCIGCGYCELACPYGNPHVDHELGHSVKCNGCAERVEQGQNPICVDACSMRAIEFGKVEELNQGDGRVAIAPLPDPSVTTPNYFVKNCRDAPPTGCRECYLANEAEVK
ncbi:MAG: 4Fe-4S dicluster domain-containing protein [Eggerthellaceae bacterium]|nr:4Fe-4S dicluster domain-containing protein [Eggerthellaceae bacterium]